LVTAHRRENFGAPYERICEAVRTLASRYKEHLFLWPLHLNPNARETAIAHLQGVANIRLTEPLGYRAMVCAMARAALIITDSGGVQEEAPALGTPVLVLRESTERPEAVTAGAAELVGTNTELIIDRATSLLAGDSEREPLMVYGDGRASERIARVLTGGRHEVDPFRPQVAVESARA
jgi:UDP-N-acetylglucosamine 2-epimerase (non-hydrolysing)/UDP-N-acetylglucosamine 2-epimerase (hydrolysing)